MEHKFRKATNIDILTLVELNKSIQEIHNELEPEIFHPNLNKTDTEKFFSSIMSKDKNIVLLIETDKTVSGMAWIEYPLIGSNPPSSDGSALARKNRL